LVPELKLPGIVVVVVVAGIVVVVVVARDVVVVVVGGDVGCVMRLGEESVTFFQINRPRERTHLKVVEPTRRTCPAFRHCWPGLTAARVSSDAAETLSSVEIGCVIPRDAITNGRTKRAMPLNRFADGFIL
jgi:hypothetical protein